MLRGKYRHANVKYIENIFLNDILNEYTATFLSFYIYEIPDDIVGSKNTFSGQEQEIII